jgi:hypothetical protein
MFYHYCLNTAVFTNYLIDNVKCFLVSEFVCLHLDERYIIQKRNKKWYHTKIFPFPLLQNRTDKSAKTEELYSQTTFMLFNNVVFE